MYEPNGRHQRNTHPGTPSADQAPAAHASALWTRGRSRTPPWPMPGHSAQPPWQSLQAATRSCPATLLLAMLIDYADAGLFQRHVQSYIMGHGCSPFLRRLFEAGLSQTSCLRGKQTLAITLCVTAFNRH